MISIGSRGKCAANETAIRFCAAKAAWKQRNTKHKKGTNKMNGVGSTDVVSLEYLNEELSRYQVDDVRIGEFDALQIVVRDKDQKSCTNIRSYYGNWRFVSSRTIVSGYLHSYDDRKKLSEKILASLVRTTPTVIKLSDLDIRISFSNGMFVDFFSVFDDDIVLEVYGDLIDEIEYVPFIGFKPVTS